jgi:cell division protein ZapA
MADKPSTTTSPGSSTVHVEIFGQTYTVKAGADPGYVEELAAYVDAQMREVGKTAGAVDSVRVAVLAALNIADECFRLRRQVRDADERAAARAASLVRELSAALGE